MSSSKESIRDLGFSVRKNEDEEWEVAQWEDAEDFEEVEYDPESIDYDATMKELENVSISQNAEFCLL